MIFFNGWKHFVGFLVVWTPFNRSKIQEPEKVKMSSSTETINSSVQTLFFAGVLWDFLSMADSPHSGMMKKIISNKVVWFISKKFGHDEILLMNQNSWALAS